MTDSQRQLTNELTILRSRKAATEEEMADAQRPKSASPEVLKKRVADLGNEIAQREAQLNAQSGSDRDPLDHDGNGRKGGSLPKKKPAP